MYNLLFLLSSDPDTVEVLQTYILEHKTVRKRFSRDSRKLLKLWTFQRVSDSLSDKNISFHYLFKLTLSRHAFVQPAIKYYSETYYVERHTEIKSILYRLKTWLRDPSYTTQFYEHTQYNLFWKFKNAFIGVHTCFLVSNQFNVV